MNLKISLNGSSITSSMIEIGGQYSILDHLKGAIKLLKISRSFNGIKGKEKLWGDKYLVSHIFRLSIFIRLMLLTILGVKGIMALFVFSRVISVLLWSMDYIISSIIELIEKGFLFSSIQNISL